MRQSITDIAPSVAAVGPRCRRLLITAPGAVELIEEHLLPVGERDVYARTVISGTSRSRLATNRWPGLRRSVRLLPPSQPVT